MKNLIYVRVSTGEQDHALQLDACEKWCSAHDVVAVVYTDTITGASTSRPMFDKLMEEVRRGGVERVICYKLDRFGRSLSHLALTFEELKAHGTAFVSVTQGLDTSNTNPMGQMQLGILMVFAEFERSLIKDRVNAGIASAKKRGVKFGRPTTHAVTTARVKDMMAQGMTQYAIAKATGVNRGTINRLAKKNL